MSADMIDVEPKTRLEGVRYPDAGRLRRYAELGLLGGETLAGAFARSFALHADRLALVGPQLRMSYRELDRDSDRLGAAMLAMGLVQHDRVLLQSGNCAELLVAFLACLKAGLIPICALQAFRKLEVGYLAKLADARLHLVQGDDARFDDVAFAREMQAAVPTLRHIVQARGEPRAGAHGLRRLIDGMPWERARTMLADVEHDPWQVAVFQLSGGTTGVPKIIPRFQSEYLYNMREVAACNGYTRDDVLFFPTPYMHNLNMGCCFGPFLLCGGAVTVAPDLAEETLCALVREHRPTWFGAPGPILTRIVPELARAGEGEKARRRFITSKNAGGMARLTGSPARHIFGMTEGVIMFTREDDPRHLNDGSVGRPVSAHDEVKIVRPGTEEPVADGEVGEALFRGPYTIQGYYKSAAEDAHRFTADGHYRSGDLMSSRVEGGRRYYFFQGRIKDVIDRGGEKINAEEVEGVVSRHPAILNCALVGMPDPVYGEKACLFATLRPSACAPDVEELGRFLHGEGLAKFKWPERIEVLADFPLSASGKLSKQILRERIAAILARPNEELPT